MLPLGLSAAEQRAFHRALKDHHTVQTTVQVMNLDRKRLADVSLRLVEGSVNVLNDAETTRGASLNLFDPKGHIALDSGDPSDGAMFLNNAVRIVNSYTWAGFDDWVDVHVFDGPVTSVNRDDMTLAVECQGWESVARNAVWEPKTYGVNYVVVLIKQLLRMAGETRFDIPNEKDIPRITTETTALSRTSKPWARAQDLAKSIDRQLFYDGRGVVRLRRLPKKRCWTFTDGDNGSITQAARVSFDVSEVRNIVWVKGRKPKGEERVDGWAKLPAGNPLSPSRLGRNDQPRYLLEVVENDHMKTSRACHEKAVDLVNDRAEQAVSVEFDAMPIPHLEPGDLVGVDTAKIQQEFRLRRFTIPLTPDAQGAAYGYTREIVKGRKAHNRPIRPMIIGDNNVFGGQWTDTAQSK